MTAPVDPLAGWRTARRARELVATVASAPAEVATAPKPQETAIVASVATVSGGNDTPEVAAAPAPDGEDWTAIDAWLRGGFPRMAKDQAE